MRGDHLATFGAGAECTDGGIVDYDDGAFVGQYQVWESCGGTESAYVVLATNPTIGGEHTFLTIVHAVTSADLEALDQVFATFNITGA